MSAPRIDVPFHASALWAYESTSPSDLCFNAGDRIIVDEQVTPQWWKGRSSTNPAAEPKLFPASRVKPDVAGDVLADEPSQGTAQPALELAGPVRRKRLSTFFLGLQHRLSLGTLEAFDCLLRDGMAVTAMSVASVKEEAAMEDRAQRADSTPSVDMPRERSSRASTTGQYAVTQLRTRWGPTWEAHKEGFGPSTRMPSARGAQGIPGAAAGEAAVAGSEEALQLIFPRVGDRVSIRWTFCIWTAAQSCAIEVDRSCVSFVIGSVDRRFDGASAAQSDGPEAGTGPSSPNRLTLADAERAKLPIPPGLHDAVCMVPLGHCALVVLGPETAYGPTGCPPLVPPLATVVLRIALEAVNEHGNPLGSVKSPLSSAGTLSPARSPIVTGSGQNPRLSHKFSAWQLRNTKAAIFAPQTTVHNSARATLVESSAGTPAETPMTEGGSPPIGQPVTMAASVHTAQTAPAVVSRRAPPPVPSLPPPRVPGSVPTHTPSVPPSGSSAGEDVTPAPVSFATTASAMSAPPLPPKRAESYSSPRHTEPTAQPEQRSASQSAQMMAAARRSGQPHAMAALASEARAALAARRAHLPALPASESSEATTPSMLSPDSYPPTTVAPSRQTVQSAFDFTPPEQ